MTTWNDQFRNRMRRFAEMRCAGPGEMSVSIKIRVTWFQVCPSCAPSPFTEDTSSVPIGATSVPGFRTLGS